MALFSIIIRFSKEENRTSLHIWKLENVFFTSLKKIKSCLWTSSEVQVGKKRYWHKHKREDQNHDLINSHNNKLFLADLQTKLNWTEAAFPFTCLHHCFLSPSLLSLPHQASLSVRWFSIFIVAVFYSFSLILLPVFVSHGLFKFPCNYTTDTIFATNDSVDGANAA